MKEEIGECTLTYADSASEVQAVHLVRTSKLFACKAHESEAVASDEVLVGALLSAMLDAMGVGAVSHCTMKAQDSTVRIDFNEMELGKEVLTRVGIRGRPLCSNYTWVFEHVDNLEFMLESIVVNGVRHDHVATREEWLGRMLWYSLLIWKVAAAEKK